MKKLSPYMLVRKASISGANDAPGSTSSAKPPSVPRPPKGQQGTNPAETRRRAGQLRATSPELARTFNKLDSAFRNTLLASCERVPALPGKVDGATKRKLKSDTSATAPDAPLARSSERRQATNKSPGVTGSDQYLTQIARELSRMTKVQRIGLLDLGVWIAGLPALMSRLNAAQVPYTLFEINAPVPAGLRKTTEGMDAWMQSHGVQLKKSERAALQPQVIAGDFFTVAHDIRTGMGLDMVVGLIPVMVAGESDEGVYWNHYCSVSDGAALVSTADLREFAATAGRPFEAAVGVLLIGAILVRFNSKLSYHDNRGCIFDYNEDRVSLIDTIKTLKLCADCAKHMSAEQKGATEAMLAVLRKMKRKSK